MVYKKFTFSTPFLRGYKQLRIPIVDNDGNPAWPDVFPMEKIEELRQTVGARHFSAQMMLNYVAADRTRLDPGALHVYDHEFDVRTGRIGDVIITGAAVYWDPAGGRARGDASVCVLIYRDDKNRRVFVHDIMYMIVDDNDLHPLGHQCDQVLDFLGRHGLRRVAVETNGIGNALPEIMRDTAKRRGMAIHVTKVTNSQNKETRILDAIEPILSTGRLYMHNRVRTSLLCAEMMEWTPIGGAVHDDGLDALAGAIRITPAPVHAGGIGPPRVYNATTNFKI